LHPLESAALSRRTPIPAIGGTTIYDKMLALWESTLK
jgi:hypothetical protein